MGMIGQYIRQNFAMILLSLLIFYFLMAALQGEMGFFRLLQVEARIDSLGEERDSLVNERERLEELTKRLSDNYLDLDLLDEQARKRLGLVRENEIIIH